MKQTTYKKSLISFPLVLLILIASGTLFGQERVKEQYHGSVHLVRAAMAESMDGLEPVHEAVVFSVDRNRIICFTEFNQVDGPSIIYHRWYQRGTLIVENQLTLKPPRWATFSSMQLRATDIGPWQVEVLTEQGRTLKILRFSITE